MTNWRTLIADHRFRRSHGQVDRHIQSPTLLNPALRGRLEGHQLVRPHSYEPCRVAWLALSPSSLPGLPLFPIVVLCLGSSHHPSTPPHKQHAHAPIRISASFSFPVTSCLLPVFARRSHVLVKTLHNAIYMIVTTFYESLSAFTFPPAYATKLQDFLDFAI